MESTMKKNSNNNTETHERKCMKIAMITDAYMRFDVCCMRVCVCASVHLSISVAFSCETYAAS